MNNDARIQVKFTGDTSSLDSATSKASKTLGSLKGLAKGVGNAFIAGTVTAVGTAKAALISYSKQSLQARADLEQNLGGVETLFKENADKVVKNAKEAYKTAGVSANEYMQGVTSFAASLLQSTAGNTEKAADVADMAFKDMSDNANKFGTDMAAIQNAYQGFAKQNYTMLDNLKLGYGGTKTEMERLLKDAEKLTGQKYDISNLKDVYEAIHAIQENLGVTGTTAEEAEKTISGSMNMAKKSFENFLAGTASGKDVAKAFTVAAKNITNELVKILPYLAEGLGELINGLIPLIPGLVNKLAPILTKAIFTLLKSIFKSTPTYLKPLLVGIAGITAAFKTITVAIKIIKVVKTALVGLKTIITVINAVMLANPIGLIIAAVVALIAIFVILWKKCEGFRNFWINLWGGIKSAVSDAWNGIKEGVSNIWKSIKNIFTTIINFVKDNWKSILLFLINPFWGAFSYLYDHCEKFRTFIDKIVTSIVNFFKSIPAKIEAIPGKIIAFINKVPYYIGYALGWILGKWRLFYSKMWFFIKYEIPKAINSVIEWIKQLPGKIWNIFIEIGTAVKSAIEWIKSLPSIIWGILVDIANKVKTWAIDIAVKARDAALQFINNVITFIKQLPGKIWAFLSNVIAKVIQWGSQMVSKGKQAAINLFNAIVNTLKSLPSKMLSIGKNIVSGLWKGIKSSTTWIKNKVNDFAKGILKGMKDALGINSPSKETEWMADMLGLGFTKELDKIMPEIERKINSTFSLNPSVTNSASTNLSPQINVINQNSFEIDPLGQLVNKVKTFQGGAKNDYNYGKA